MDKLDKFFKEQLTDYKASTDEWNIPSDHLYDEAKVFFPKKKKRRFFIWFIGLALLCVGFSLGMFVTRIDQSDIVSENSDSERITQGPITTKILKKKESETIGQKLPADKKSEINDYENTIKETSKKKTVSQNNTISNSYSVSNSDQAKQESNLLSNTEEINISTTTNTFSQIVKESQNTIISKESSEDDTVSAIENIDFLQTKISLIENKSEKPHLIEANFTPTKGKINSLQDEVGISHLYFVANLFDEVELSEESVMEETQFSGKFKNLNLNYSRFIHNRWSISTGVFLSQINIDLDFSVYEKLNSEDIDVFVNEEFDDISPRSTDQNNMVSLMPGVNLSEGDLLNFRGDVALQLRAIQLPFTINYHLNKRRTEYFVGAGLSIDYVLADQSAIDLEIYKDNILINNPYVQERQVENEFSYSIYFNTGLRYRISSHLNVGFNAKINVNDIIFSGLEAGIYYRWNRT